MKEKSSPEFISREVRLDTQTYNEIEDINPQVQINSVYGVLILYPDNIVFRVESRDKLMKTEYRTLIDRDKIKSLQLFGNEVSEKASAMKIIAGLISVFYILVSGYLITPILTGGFSELDIFVLVPMTTLTLSIYFFIEFWSLNTEVGSKLAMSDGQNRYVIRGESDTLYDIYANLSQEVPVDYDKEETAEEESTKMLESP